MSYADVSPRRGFGATSRRDLWWVQPLAVFLGLSAFLVYTTWAAFQGQNYFYHGGGAHYLSPFYSPLLFGESHEPRWFSAARPGWWPGWLPFSSAFLILVGPAGFRFTCYYYRGAYYKAFWADPPNCSVGEPRKTYLGERSLPLILQNVHRYFFYFAVLFIFVLFYDALRAMFFEGGDGRLHFGMGVGSLVLLMNVFLLGGYTFGCHCLRHLVGGRKNTLACSPVQSRCYDCASSLNRRHMMWAWLSLVWVGFSDVYVRLCAMGIWTDWRIF
ncbi:MAG: succinate dehydrogenase [Candidatus Sumerlaeaceae bacterium]